MFLTISESDAFRCTVNTALDLQKAGREPSYRSPRCCVLCSSPRSSYLASPQVRGIMCPLRSANGQHASRTCPGLLICDLQCGA